MIIPFLMAAAVSWIVTRWVVKKGKFLGIIDDPARHKHPKVIHDKPVPRGGGIPIFAALLTVLFFTQPSKQVWGVIIGAAILAIVGFLDDRFEEKISPYLRLGVNILAALAVIGAGIGIAYITNPLGGVIDLSWPRWCIGSHCVWILSDVFALVWLVAMQNIVGWSSGVDGQLPGFVIIAAITIALLGWRFNVDFGQWPVIMLAAVVAGAYAGFLPWNWFPQKIMPGYGGKSLAGFLLGVLAIMSGAKVGAMMLILGLPFIDAALVIIKRLREGRSPVWGGNEHLHHYLLKRGWGKRRIALFYWGVAAVMAVAALQLNSGWKYFTMATVILVVGGVILWLQGFLTFSKQPGPDSG
ncbi:MAG: MraY family glycosyltransferase [Patescibacteria group bacterium]